MAKKTEDVMEQELTLAQMQAQMAAMLAEAQAAKAEAERVLAEAKALKEGKKTNSRMTPEELEAYEAYMNEYVEVKLFKDTGKYKDDVFVAVNGENCVIKRGERVKIKRKFAEVLDRQEREDYETAQLIERKSGEWMAKAAAL